MSEVIVRVEAAQGPAGPQGAAGVGLPVSATAGDMVYYNGTQWVATTISAFFAARLESCVSDEDAEQNFGLSEGDFYIAAVGHVALKPGTLTSIKTQ